jgi:hypothetical protein
MMAGTSAAIAPYVLPYYDQSGAGQLKGILSGLAAVDEYEDLAGAAFAPSAHANLLVQANLQILLVVVVLLSGIRSLINPRARRSFAEPRSSGSGKDRPGGKA